MPSLLACHLTSYMIALYNCNCFHGLIKFFSLSAVTEYNDAIQPMSFEINDIHETNTTSLSQLCSRGLAYWCALQCLVVSS